HRPLRDAGGSGHAAGGRVHWLRGMSHRRPRVPAARRPRVRFGVCRSDRRGVDAAADRDRAIGPLALRLEPVRRVPRRLPRQDRHPGAVAPPACSGDRAARGQKSPPRAPGISLLRRRHGAATPVRVDDARRPHLADRAAAPCVDQVARSAPARAAELPGGMAGGPARRGSVVIRTDEARGQILRSIRESLAASARHPMTHAPSDHAAPEPRVPIPEPLDLVVRFTTQLEAVGAQWTLVRGEVEAARALRRILSDAGARRVAGSDAPLVARLLPERLTRLTRDELFTCDAGVTTAQWG